MPAFRTRSGSRDGPNMTEPIRRVVSSDQNESSSLKEPLLLSMVESGELSRTASVKSRSPSIHRQSLSPTTVMMLDNNNNTNTLKLPALPTNSNNTVSHTTTSPTSKRWYTPLLVSIRHNPDSFSIGIALSVWYLVGVISICTTKLLLSTPLEEGGVPCPLILTLQQLFLGSLNMRAFLWVKGKFTAGGVGVQPWPAEPAMMDGSSNHKWFQSASLVVDFLLLSGLFNGLDFLASNTSFSHSSASFVETIKASEPITTGALAIWWGIDRLGKMETVSLTILITGVLISTYANATANDAAVAAEVATLQESIKTCLTVMTANLCFAFRAMCQKLLRNTPSGSAQNLDDFNLLWRMQQTGAASLLVPVLIFQHNKLFQVLLGRESWDAVRYYFGLSLVNAWAFATYSLASTFILSRISVVQYSGFGCLRRLFAIVVTSIAFGVPIHAVGAMGIFMSFFGFAGFTHYRFQRQGQGKKEVSSGIATKRTSMSNDDMTAPLSSGSLGSSSDEIA